MTTIQEMPVPARPKLDDWYAATDQGRAMLAQHEKQVATFRQAAIDELRAVERKETADLSVAEPAATAAKARLDAMQKAHELAKKECLPLIATPERIRRAAGFQKNLAEAKLIKTVPACIGTALQQIEYRVDEIRGLEDASDLQAETIALVYKRCDIRKLSTSTAAESEIVREIEALNAIRLPTMTADEVRELHAQCQQQNIATLRGVAEFAGAFLERMAERRAEIAKDQAKEKKRG
jgi:hypothetical protein